MNPVVLRTVARLMTPVLLLLSLVLLLRGHNAPGGGFVGGLMTASALILYLIAYDVETVRRMVRLSPITLLGLGLLVMLGSGMLAMVYGRPFLTGLWAKTRAPWGHHVDLGTPLLFDLGVYLVVVGTTLGFILALAEEEQPEPEAGHEREEG